MKKIWKAIKSYLFGSIKEGEKAYPETYSFKTTYPERRVSEEAWKVLHNVKQE